jgi:hypothetical protein
MEMKAQLRAEAY